MNDKDFDKIFGDRLREERKFREDDNEWKGLAGRLDAVNSDGAAALVVGNSNKFLRWLLPLIALLLLLTTGFLFGKLNNLDKKNTALSEQMQTIKTQLTTTHDTVFITKTDTVFIEQNGAKQFIKTTSSTSKTNDFNELNKANYSQSNSPKKAQLINAKSSADFNSKQLINGNEKELTNKINELENRLQNADNQRLAMNDEIIKLKGEINKTPLESALNNHESTNKLVEKTINKSEDKSDSFNLILANKDALIAQLNSQLIAKKTIDSTQLKKQLIAKDSTQLNAQLTGKGPLSINTKNTLKISKKPITARLFAGVSGGGIYYKASWISAQNNLEIYRNEKSYQAGLKLEYALTDRVRLTAGGDYCPFDFQIFWQDSRYNLPTPQHFYPAKDKIKSSKASQKLAQVSLGSKLMLTDGTKRWRPYVGAAYAAMKILPFDAEFEVQNIASGAIRTLNESSTGLTIANLLLLDGGLEYRFNRRFVVQGEAFYNLDMNRPQKTYDLFGLRGAFLFNF